MKPESTNYKSDPKYFRTLIEGAEISQRKAAEIIGISPRTIRSYLSGDRPIPYSVQFVLECYLDYYGRIGHRIPIGGGISPKSAKVIKNVNAKYSKALSRLANR